MNAPRVFMTAQLQLEGSLLSNIPWLQQHLHIQANPNMPLNVHQPAQQAWLDKNAFPAGHLRRPCSAFNALHTSLVPA